MPNLAAADGERRLPALLADQPSNAAESPIMRTASRKPITKRTSGVLRWALAAAVAAGCDHWLFDGTSYRAGHGIVVWHPAPVRGGFLPWAFRVTTPAAGAPYVALERVAAGPAAPAEVLAEVPLPAGAKEVPVRLDVEQRRRAVLRVADGTRVDVAAPLPLCCRGAGGLVASPAVLPQDSAGAIVLEYVVSERLARSDSASFEVARRLEGASYVRLRFGVRP